MQYLPTSQWGKPKLASIVSLPPSFIYLNLKLLAVFCREHRVLVHMLGVKPEISRQTELPFHCKQFRRPRWTIALYQWFQCISIHFFLVIGSTETLNRVVIVAPPQNATVVLGRPAVMECMAQGQPKPLVSWSRQGNTPKCYHSIFSLSGSHAVCFLHLSLFHYLCLPL